MRKLNLKWKILDGNHVAFIFDKPAWPAFRSPADSRGIDTGEMITEALVKLRGPAFASRSKE